MCLACADTFQVTSGNIGASLFRVGKRLENNPACRLECVGRRPARSQPCPSTALRGSGANLTSTGAVKLAPALALASRGARRTSPCAAEIDPPLARDEKRHVDFGPDEATAKKRDNKHAFRWRSVVVRPASSTAIEKQRGAIFSRRPAISSAASTRLPRSAADPSRRGGDGRWFAVNLKSVMSCPSRAGNASARPAVS